MKHTGAFLLIVTQGGNRQTFSFSQDLVTIGRARECDLSLSDRVVSRRHCHIERIDGAFVLVQDEGQNPVMLHGKPIERVPRSMSRVSPPV